MFEQMDPSVLRARARGVARALKAISLENGRAFTMDTKAGRFRIQKAVYLLKRLDYPPATRFDYDIYLNGPYSPNLAQAYYALGDNRLSAATPAPDLPPKSIGVVVDAIALGEDFLEGLTTVVDGTHRSQTVAQALSWAESIKPHLGERTWQEVGRFLAQHPELMRHT